MCLPPQQPANQTPASAAKRPGRLSGGRPLCWHAELVRAASEEELNILRLLLSIDFEGVDALRIQAAALREVEPNCTCGCPSISPHLDRTSLPPARLTSMLPVEIIEMRRADGVPRTVLCFLDEYGYLGNLECTYYDMARPQWPDPQDCAVLLNDRERHLEAVLLPSGALVRPHQPSDRWRSVEMHEDLGFCATTWNGYRECYAPDGTQLTRVSPQ